MKIAVCNHFRSIQVRLDRKLALEQVSQNRVNKLFEARWLRVEMSDNALLYALRQMRSGKLVGVKRKLLNEIKRRGGLVVDESCGRWNVLQLEAPKGQMWSEGLSAIRVAWHKGESPDDTSGGAGSKKQALVIEEGTAATPDVSFATMLWRHCS
jgi:hypothetical protein